MLELESNCCTSRDPAYSSATLQREGIRPRTIVGVILTHCHADHDAGAFQKILTGSPVVVITTLPPQQFTKVLSVNILPYQN
jgi:glyoxylase-like metal-dependent hydrolase (beta-lactamase superfamily II)